MYFCKNICVELVPLVSFPNRSELDLSPLASGDRHKNEALCMRPLDLITQCEWLASVEQNHIHALEFGSGPVAQSHFALGMF